MNKLEFGFKHLCERNKDGSYSTQANRKRMLSLFARELKDVGFKPNKMRPSDIKGRHVKRLVDKWQKEGVKAGTIKNRMAVVRWWAEKVGNTGAVKSNADYGIEKRVYVTNTDKSVSLSDVDFSKLDDHVAQSLRMQDAFGLRREESMKFQTRFALDGQKPESAKYIKIKGSWSKGGRPRTIPITSQEQRRELARCVSLVGEGSLIPVDKTYKAHLATFEKQTHEQGIGRTHGLRHGYAQRRYKQLTKVDCPAVSSKTRQLTERERGIDKKVRMIISEELGHSRINITSVYLGSWGK